MGFGIFRVEKLKSMGNVKQSLMHAFREHSRTPNADPSRTSENLKLSDVSSVEEAMNKYDERLKARNKPTPIRADQVRGIEVIVTASPESMAKMSREEQIQFLKDGLNFSNKEFGEDNLIHAEIHFDETTPHLTAFYIPLSTKTYRGGKVYTDLNAKDLMGGKTEYVKRQTKFFEEVSSKYGLERGKENSQAEHTTVKEFYRRINESMKLEDPDFLAGVEKMTARKLENVPSDLPILGKPRTFDVEPYIQLKYLNAELDLVKKKMEMTPFYGTQSAKKKIEKETARRVAEEQEKLNSEYDKKVQEFEFQKAEKLKKLESEYDEKRTVLNAEYAKEFETVEKYEKELTERWLNFLKDMAKTVKVYPDFIATETWDEFQNRIKNAVNKAVERFSKVSDDLVAEKAKNASMSHFGALNAKLEKDYAELQKEKWDLDEKLEKFSTFKGVKEKYQASLIENYGYIEERIAEQTLKFHDYSVRTRHNALQETYRLLDIAKGADMVYYSSLQIKFGEQIAECEQYLNENRHLLSTPGMSNGR